MASVSRVALVNILFLYIIFAATAPSPLSINHVAIQDNQSPFPTTSLTPSDIAYVVRTKRARQNIGSWGETYALPYGWSVTVTTMSIFMDFGSQAAALWFNNFYWELQVFCAAQMLGDRPFDRHITVEQGPWKLMIGMHPDSTVQQIEWSFIYYFAMYMRNWVANGFTGTGGIMFKHTSGIKVVAFFMNDQGRVGPVLY